MKTPTRTQARSLLPVAAGAAVLAVVALPLARSRRRRGGNGCPTCGEFAVEQQAPNPPPTGGPGGGGTGCPTCLAEERTAPS